MKYYILKVNNRNKKNKYMKYPPICFWPGKLSVSISLSKEFSCKTSVNLKNDHFCFLHIVVDGSHAAFNFALLISEFMQTCKEKCDTLFMFSECIEDVNTKYFHSTLKQIYFISYQLFTFNSTKMIIPSFWEAKYREFRWQMQQLSQRS